MYHTQGVKALTCDHLDQKARAGRHWNQGQPGLQKQTLLHKRGRGEKVLHASDKNVNTLGVTDISAMWLGTSKKEKPRCNGACLQS